MIKKRNKDRLSSGFTIVELIVASTLATIMGIVIVGTIVSFSQQFSTSSVRQELNTNAQSAIAQINDDIRNSTGIGMYNTVQDPEAPTTVVAPFTDVPVPSGLTAQQYNWRFGENRLILIQPARDAAGKPIYTSPTTFDGPKNNIIYYVKNNALYRRVVAAPENAIPTIQCSQETDTLGGCTKGPKVDQKMLSNFKTSNGLGDLTINYIDQNGNTITKGTTGSQAERYSVFAKTKMVSVDSKQNLQKTGANVAETTGSKVAFRTQSATQVTDSPFFDYSVIAGPGGIDGTNDAQITGLNVATQGGIRLRYGNIIGTRSNPANIIASNKGCGNGADYGTIMCGDQPVSLFWNAGLYGNVCAKNQRPINNVGRFFGEFIKPGNAGTQYDQGVLPSSCGPPDINMPQFNKAAQAAQMTNTKTGSNAGCDGLGGGRPTTTFSANTTYVGDVDMYWNCTTYLEGSIHIKGNFSQRYGARLIVGENVTSQPIIMVDGSINLFNSTIIQPNSKGIAPFVISFDSVNDKCSSSVTCWKITRNGNCPNAVNCTALSNSELQRSVNNDGIYISMGATAPSTLFYSYFSGMTVYWQGEVKAGVLAAQRLSYTYGSDITLNK